MIFLSHNENDKPIVENLALRLESIFGRDNIFYDSWSIQPGEGLIDKMDSGLEKAKFFFFFVSKNSLKSDMVKLEWQNALMKSIKTELRFIPVRMDQSSMPAILTQSLYIDLYKNGFEVALAQIVQVASGQNTFAPAFQGYTNIIASIKHEAQKATITVIARNYLEVIPRIAVMHRNEQGTVSIRIVDEMLVQSGSGSGQLVDGRSGNLLSVVLPHPITPGFPVTIEVQTNNGLALEFVEVLYEAEKNSWIPIPRQS